MFQNSSFSKTQVVHITKRNPIPESTPGLLCVLGGGQGPGCEQLGQGWGGGGNTAIRFLLQLSQVASSWCG